MSYLVNSTDPIGITPTTNPISTAGVDASGIKRNILVDASGSQLSRVGGFCTKVSPDVAPVVTSGSAYTTGNIVGGLLHLTAVARANIGSGLVQSVITTCASLQSAYFDVLFFNSNPSSTTFIDKTALSIASVDLLKIIGVAHCTDVSGFSAQSIHQATSLALPFALASNTDMYMAIVVRGTPTFTTINDVNISIRIVQD